MTGMGRRLEKLERNGGAELELPIVFISSASGGHGKPIISTLTLARVPGVGQIKRLDGETEEAFARRAYAMRVSGKRIEDMTDEELETAMAAGDERIALEKARTGGISDQSLERLRVEQDNTWTATQ